MQFTKHYSSYVCKYGKHYWPILKAEQVQIMNIAEWARNLIKFVGLEVCVCMCVAKS